MKPTELPRHKSENIYNGKKTKYQNEFKLLQDNQNSLQTIVYTLRLYTMNEEIGLLYQHDHSPDFTIAIIDFLLLHFRSSIPSRQGLPQEILLKLNALRKGILFFY